MKTFLLRSSIVMAIALQSANLKAQENYLDMQLEQLMRIPVTGSTLRDESIKTVPAAVTIFTREQLDRMGVDYLFELINLVPGYQFDRGADSGVNYTFSARGRRNSSVAREVLVLIDGRIFANPRTGAADSNYSLVPLEQIERVEVIRGPGSALYGSSAYNGVINIITRTNRNGARLQVGSDGRRGASLAVNQHLGEWNGNAFFQVYKDDGQEFLVKNSFTGQPLVTDDPREAINIDASLERNETRLRASFHRTHSDNFYIVEKTFNGFNSTDQGLAQMSLEQGVNWSDQLSSKIYVGYLRSRLDVHIPVLGPGMAYAISNPHSMAPVLTLGKFAGENINLRFTNNWYIDEKSHAIFGVEWKREREVRATGYGNFDVEQLVTRKFPINYYGDFSHSYPVGSNQLINAGGLYGEYLRDINDSTHLTLGARYDHHENFGSHTSPRMGLVHQLTDTQTVKLLYGQAYRAPSISETGIASNPLVVGNPNLNSEIVKTWDLIWMLNWKSTSISLGAFDNHYDGPIVAGFVDGVRTYLNAPEEHSNGLEAELRQHFGDNWSLRATYTDFMSMPSTTFREAKKLASAEINFNQGPWNWNLLTYHQGPRQVLMPNNMRHDLDSFWVMNTKLAYTFSQGYKMSLQAKNIEDENFATPVQGAGLPQGVPNRGREVSLNLEWGF